MQSVQRLSSDGGQAMHYVSNVNHVQFVTTGQKALVHPIHYSFSQWTYLSSLIGLQAVCVANE